MADRDVLDDATLHIHTADRRKMLQKVILGAVLGFISAVVLSSVLYLTVTNDTFATLYSVALVFCGGGLIARARLRPKSNVTALMSTIEHIGGFVVMASAATTYFSHHHRSAPTYFLLVNYSFTCSASMYALSYAVVDGFNQLAQHGVEMNAKQVYAMTFASIIVGGGCGLSFAAVDVEAHAHRFGYEQWIAACLASCGAAVIGFASHVSRDEALKVAFDPLPMDDFTPSNDNRNFDVEA